VSVGGFWLRLAWGLVECFVTGGLVTEFTPMSRTVNGDYRYDRLVTTIPWPTLRNKGALPPEIETAVAQLEHTSVDVDYYPENVATPSHWTYEPSEDVSYHRLLFRHNFCRGSRGYW